MRRSWTEAELAWLIALYPHERTSDVAFALAADIGRIYAKANQLGLFKSDEYLASPFACRLRRGAGVGAASRFQKGQTPWNKGMHYQPGGRIKESQFKRGGLPHNTHPIGSYRINGDGYLDRKVAERPGPPNRRWTAVHRLVWEAANGAVPAGHVVVFKRGMRTAVLEEITIDRVELITRVELMRRNTIHNYPKPIARAIQLKGALMRQINKRTRHAHD